MKFWKYFGSIVLFLVSLTLDANQLLDTVSERIKNRTFPSTFDVFGGIGWVSVENRPDLSDEENIALADLQATSTWHGVRWWPISSTIGGGEIKLRQYGDLEKARRTVEQIRSYNPNIVLLQWLAMREATVGHKGHYPEDSPVWIRDADGNLVNSYGSDWYLVDFTMPEVQEIIIKQAIAAQDSGMYDGVFFDYWTGSGDSLRVNGVSYRSVEAQQEARNNIIRGIRESTHPDFLILVNSNIWISRIEQNAHLINGSYMETWSDQNLVGSYAPSRLAEIEDKLIWVSNNTREPQINALEGTTRRDADETEKSRLMRLFTTMSLTLSNGYVLFAERASHGRIWREFQYVDLGRPVSEKQQRLKGVGYGSFIREFDNGWVVYNRNRNAQVVELPAVTASVATGNYDYIHEVPPVDGDIFLRSHPTSVTPHGLLTTSWGAIKLWQRGKSN